MAFLTLADGEQLYYEVHGQGPPLLFVSGLGGTANFWSSHVEHFAASHTVILHDHRGTGQSSPSEIDYSIAQMADDVVQLMDALGVEHADLLGHSTGGAIGQSLALDHAQRLGKLVLSATWAGKDPYFELLFTGKRRILVELGAEEYLRALLMDAYPPEWLRDHADAVARPSPADVAARVPSLYCGTSRIDAILDWDRRLEVGGIASETLVICARDDVITPAYLSEELAKLIPGASAHYLDNGGHFYTNSRAEEFRIAVSRFLA